MTSPWPRSPPTGEDRAAYAQAAGTSFWLDDLPARAPHPPLQETRECDLCIVGGGYTGLWAALAAKAADPDREVVLLEAGRCATGASGRNGGFLDASLTHGLSHGLARFPAEIALLERLGADNFRGLRDDVHAHGIDADWEEPGDLAVAIEPHELAWLSEEADALRRFGHRVELLDGDQIRVQVQSPTYLGGLWSRGGSALVHPGKLGEGLRQAVVRTGTRIFENSGADALSVNGTGVRVLTTAGRIDARRVLVATGAYPAPISAIRRYVAPVYDYALMTEPLTPEQRRSIGWTGRQGISDVQNRFHYYRLSGDGRILWGGYDAVYRYGGPVGPHLDEHDATFARLSQHFFVTFPQLRGVRFSHRWGGPIDTCSRFSVFFGSALGGRVTYAAGYTGLGVGAARFGGRVALDLLDGRDTEATRSDYVRRRPVPFPREPLRAAVIGLTQNRLAAADRRQGRRGRWLRALDRLGVGFDS
jgi:glycine/D-amino acid oxidase-like deaminating enzyme